MAAQLSVDDFSWEERCWVASVRLPSWAGFQSRGGPYGALDPEQPSNGFVRLVYAPEGRGDDPLTAAELERVGWVLAHEHDLFIAVTEALLQHYPSLRDLYSYVPRAVMPEAVTAPSGFTDLIGLCAVNVHNVRVDGPEPYLGFEFGCSWDEEHGLGLMLCGLRCIEIGGADTALLRWIAQRDASADPRE